MRPSLCLSILLALVATRAQAADWYLVASNADGGHFVDKASIVERGSVRTVADSSNLFEPRPNGIRSIESRTEWDCDKRTQRLVSSKAFSATGQIMYDVVVPESQRTTDPVREGSIPGEMLEFACGRDPYPTDWLPIQVRDTPAAVMGRARELTAIGAAPSSAVLLAGVDPAAPDVERLLDAAVPAAARSRAKEIMSR